MSGIIFKVRRFKFVLLVTFWKDSDDSLQGTSSLADIF